MKKLLVSWIFCLFLVWFAAPVTASGYLDELFLTTEWWPQESQTGSLELNYFKRMRIISPATRNWARRG